MNSGDTPLEVGLAVTVSDDQELVGQEACNFVKEAVRWLTADLPFDEKRGLLDVDATLFGRPRGGLVVE